MTSVCTHARTQRAPIVKSNERFAMFFYRPLKRDKQPPRRMTYSLICLLLSFRCAFKMNSVLSRQALAVTLAPFATFSLRASATLSQDVLPREKGLGCCNTCFSSATSLEAPNLNRAFAFGDVSGWLEKKRRRSKVENLSFKIPTFYNSPTTSTAGTAFS